MTGEDWAARLVLAPGEGPLRAASEAAARIKTASRGAVDAARRRLRAASELGREHAAVCHDAASALATADQEIAERHSDRARIDGCLDELSARLGRRTPGETAEAAAARGRLEQARLYLETATEQPYAWIATWPKYVAGPDDARPAGRPSGDRRGRDAAAAGRAARRRGAAGAGRRGRRRGGRDVGASARGRLRGGLRRRPHRPRRAAHRGRRDDPARPSSGPVGLPTSPNSSAHRSETLAAAVRVALFITCFNDTLFPATGRAVVELLERLGHEVVFPEEQTCCGQMHGNTGYAELGEGLVRRWERVFGD